MELTDTQWFERLKARNHQKARRQKPKGYPERLLVPDVFVDWSVSWSHYNPPYCVEKVVIDNDETSENPHSQRWADPEDFSLVTREIVSYEGEMLRDQRGRPLNVRGRTGIAGRGELGKWGPNFAADPIITSVHPETGLLELLVIKRGDTGEWAIPGGMVDKGEVLSQTLRRELGEETSADLDMSKAQIVYKGYVDDPRNTDHAWMETIAAHRHISPAERDALVLRPGKEEKAVQWFALGPGFISELYASHADLVISALRIFFQGRLDQVRAPIRAQFAALLRR